MSSRAQAEAELVAVLRTLTGTVENRVAVFRREQHLHRTDLEALLHLWLAAQHGTGLSPSGLAEAVGLSRPATSALLARLTAAGHVQRLPDLDDGRRTSLSLGPAAEGIVLTWFRTLGGILRRGLRDIDEPDLRTTVTVLQSVLRALTGEETSTSA